MTTLRLERRATGSLRSRVSRSLRRINSSLRVKLLIIFAILTTIPISIVGVVS